MEFSCATVILSIREIRRGAAAVALKKIANDESADRKSNERRERASWCLREQTSTWRFSSSPVKSHGSLVWRSASATKIFGSRSWDGVAFTRIAIERLVGTRAISAFVVFPDRFFIRILIPSFLAVSHLSLSLSSPLSHRLIDFPFPSISPSLTILSSSNSVDDSPRLDSIRWLSNQIHWSLTPSSCGTF